MSQLAPKTLLDEADAPFWFLAADLVVIVVNDGWSGRPSPMLHQICLLPLLLTFGYVLWRLLKPNKSIIGIGGQGKRDVYGAWIAVLASFEASSQAGFLYEARHFARFGYHLSGSFAATLFVLFVGSIALVLRARRPLVLVGVVLAMYSMGVLAAIHGFPLY